MWCSWRSSYHSSRWWAGRELVFGLWGDAASRSASGPSEHSQTSREARVSACILSQLPGVEGSGKSTKLHNRKLNILSSGDRSLLNAEKRKIVSLKSPYSIFTVGFPAWLLSPWSWGKTQEVVLIISVAQSGNQVSVVARCWWLCQSSLEEKSLYEREREKAPFLSSNLLLFLYFFNDSWGLISDYVAAVLCLHENI